MDSTITELFATIVMVSSEDLTDETTPDTLSNWDSFKHMMLISSFEEEFDISIEPEEIVDMYKSYGAFKALINTKLS